MIHPLFLSLRHLALLSFLFVMSCAGEKPMPEGAEMGQVSIALATSTPSGTVYVLRNTSVSISVGAVEVTTLSSNDIDPLSENTLRANLEAGSYVASLDSWELFRVEDGVEVPVTAVLASPATVPFDIVADQTTSISYTFSVQDNRVVFGGNLEVAFDIQTIPTEWTCNLAFYGTGDGCDCGCGAPDPDCADATVESCAFCGEQGSCAGTSVACPANIDPTDNSRCVAPAEWTCSATFYDANDGCDCGCGALDPDCASNDIASCAYCDNPGSCSSSGSCPGTIDPTDIAVCTP
jgi:hypothetical protein